MNVGSKTASAVWLVIVAIGTTLLSFGLSDDPNNILRDAAIEISILREGPNQTFLEVCKEFERRRERGVIMDPSEDETREEWVARYLGGNKSTPWLSSDFKVGGLIWCPFPSRDMTVKEALALVTNVNSTSLTLWPRSTFLESLGSAIREQQQAINQNIMAVPHDEYFKFHALASDIANGKKISWMNVTSDPKPGSHMMFECTNTEITFDPTNTMEIPKFPVQLIISLENDGTYCFQADDIPSSIKYLYGADGKMMTGLYTGYFGMRIGNSSRYSNKAAAEAGTRYVPEENQVPNKNGSITVSEWYGFDFPALRSQIKEIGTLTIEQAYGILNARARVGDGVAELFGIKMPIRLFLISTLISLPVFAAIFLGGYRQHDIGALPEALQGLPKPLPLMAIIGTICVLPASGLYLLTNRLQFLFPDISPFFQLIAALWVIGSAIVLVRTYKVRKVNY